MLCLLFANLVNAQEQLTLKDALNFAIQNNVNARKAKLDIDGGKYKTEEIGQELFHKLQEMVV